jgi:hypothetical protein
MSRQVKKYDIELPIIPQNTDHSSHDHSPIPHMIIPQNLAKSKIMYYNNSIDSIVELRKGSDGEVLELEPIKYELGDAAANLKELGDSL